MRACRRRASRAKVRIVLADETAVACHIGMHEGRQSSRFCPSHRLARCCLHWSPPSLNLSYTKLLKCHGSLTSATGGAARLACRIEARGSEIGQAMKPQVARRRSNSQCERERGIIAQLIGGCVTGLRGVSRDPLLHEIYRDAEPLAELLRRSQGQPPPPDPPHRGRCLERIAGLCPDLGCGAGRDTLTLLARGWRVHAIDTEQDAFARLEQSVPTKERVRLTWALRRFEDIDLPKANLANASFSLPSAALRCFPVCGGRWCRLSIAEAFSRAISSVTAIDGLGEQR